MDPGAPRDASPVGSSRNGALAKRLEGVDTTDGDEHSVAGAVVGELRAVLGSDDRPPLRGVGAIVDGDDGDVPEVAEHPLELTVGGDTHAVGRGSVDSRGAGEGASQATSVVLIWHRVWPDLVVMNT